MLGFRSVGALAALLLTMSPALADTELEVDAGIELGSRNFDGASVDRLGNIRGFSGGAMPMPFASAQVWLGESFGVYSHITHSVGAKARYAVEEGDLDSALSDARVDAKWRRGAGPYTGVASVGAGRTRMSFEPSGIVNVIAEDLPGIDYRYLRAGLHGRYDQGFATLYAGIGALVGQDEGLVAEYLGSDVAGVDFELGASAELSEDLDLRLMLNLRDISHTETNLAGDRFYGARVTLAYTR